MNHALIAIAISACSLAGCVTSKTFVDPQYHNASYESIRRLPEPMVVRVEVHFQRNGQSLPAADKELRDNVEKALRATGVFVPSAMHTEKTVEITGNNIADLGAARAKGFKTGFTFGARGSVVDDNYEFICSYETVGGVKKFSYQHALHTTIGHGRAPAGMTPTKPKEAFGRVVEDVILNFVKDLQDLGAVPKQ